MFFIVKTEINIKESEEKSKNVLANQQLRMSHLSWYAYFDFKNKMGIVLKLFSLQRSLV